MSDLQSRIMDMLQEQVRHGAGAKRKAAAGARKRRAAAGVGVEAGVRKALAAGVRAGNAKNKAAAARNPWIIFVREYAKVHNKTYRAALMDFDCSKLYQEMKARGEI